VTGVDAVNGAVHQKAGECEKKGKKKKGGGIGASRGVAHGFEGSRASAVGTGKVRAMEKKERSGQKAFVPGCFP